jgi:leucyl-tRNA synthetase
MHLLYFRFWHRVMHELGLTAEPEPCKRLVTQGIVNGPDGRKMSKRWNNVVAPGYMVDRFGADTVRLFMLFAAPPEKDMDWSDEQVDGLFRFLTRVWRLFHSRQACFAAPEADLGRATGPFLELRRRTHRTIRKVTEGMQDDLKFNTGIAALMELMNELQGLDPKAGPEQAAVREALVAMASLLAPFAPHVAEELWHEVLGPPARDRLLAEEPWPAFDAALTVADTVTIAVQVNGKLRGEVQVPAAAGEAEVRTAAEAEEKVSAYLTGKAVKKVVYVKGRLINYVVAG